MRPGLRSGLNPIWAAILVLFTLLPQSIAADSGPSTQPKRPRITGIDHVTIYVSDLNKSSRFYSNVLGLANCPHARAGSCFLVRPSNQRVLLKPAPADSGFLKTWLVEIAFATDNVAQMQKYLAGHGLATKALQKDSGGTQSFEVRDPEGNALAFVERPHSKIDDRPASKQIGAHLIHAGFVVKDLAAENRFYVDLLGFRLYWYGGFKDDGIDWYELQVPDGPDWIEYMLNIPPNADHKELGIQNHFSFGVRDVHVAATHLRANGLEKFDGPEVGRDGKDSLDAYDPDGTRVEIMEFTPKQNPCCHAYSAGHPKL